MSSDTWILSNDLCRCCHAEGCFKILNVPCCNEDGETEVYSEMLREQLGVDIQQVDGILSESTYKICEKCIERLKDVVLFKKQVITCENKFKDLLAKGRFQAVKLEILNNEVKTEDDENEGYIGATDLHDSDSDDASFQMKFSDEDSIDKDTEDEPETKKRKGKSKVKARAKTKSLKKEKPKKESTQRSGQTEPYYTIIEASGKKQYQCIACEKIYASQPLVSQHHRFVHLKKRPKERKCPKCDLKLPAYLKAYHMEEAHGIAAPKCLACGKRFRFPCQVLQHQKKVHMGERTIGCELCEKKFFNNISLRLHMLTHSAVKRFKCEVCGREFRWESNLRDHTKIHTGDRKFACRICDKTFIQKSSLKQHALRNHPGCVEEVH